MIETGARVASFAQAPNPALVARCKEAGLFVMPTVGARRHAEKVAEWGVDAVIAQGGEGGGHTGTVPTTLLLPEVVDAVGDRGARRGRRVLQRPRPGGRPLLRGRRHRHGDPVPALSPEPGARRRQGPLSRDARDGHRRHHQGGRRTTAGRAHGPRRASRVAVLWRGPAPRAAQRLPLPPGDGHDLRLAAARGARHERGQRAHVGPGRHGRQRARHDQGGVGRGADRRRRAADRSGRGRHRFVAVGR